MTRSGLCTLALVSILCGCGGGGGDDPPDDPTLVATFEGVIAGNDGVEAGTLALNFFSDGSGDGSFKPDGGVATVLGQVTATTSSFTASGGGYAFTGTFTSSTLDGSYTSANGGGLAAALRKVTGINITAFCGTHSGDAGDGPYVVVWDGTTIRGAWTSGVGSAFKGIVSGAEGDDGATMTGFADPATVLLDQTSGAMSGFYQFTGGPNGGLTGGACT